METGNQTSVVEFILLGLTSDPHLQVPLFIFFLLVYIITVVGNIGIICLYHTDSHLQTPMYFFISNLSFVDLCYSSTVTPKMLMGFMVDQNEISISECASQLFSFTAFGVAECIIISIMAYDRYTAICKPLHYTIIMTKSVCNKLALLPFVGGVIYAILETIITFSLMFCGDKIPHYFCDMLPLFTLSCTDTLLSEAILFTGAAFLGSLNLTAIGMSYYQILIMILRTHTSGGRHKLFSTCSSHLVCLVLFYGTGLNMYLRPNAAHTDEKDKVMSVFYTIIIPMLNPLIYSLRNKDMRVALRRIVMNNLFPRRW